MEIPEHNAEMESFAAGLGQIAVRFVIFSKDAAKKPSNNPGTDEDDEVDSAAPEINSYLESSSRGRHHVVFLLNGQRHHSLDRGFIVHDLGKKYISKRTLITVELEGLSREAKAQLVQGSRSGFYEGEVFHRLKARLVALLKRDPDLERLEEEAEEEISQLQASDDAVNQALDQLIEDHNPLAERSTEGQDASGIHRGGLPSSGGQSTPLAVVVKGIDGEVAGGPFLIGRNAPKTLRLRPNQTRYFVVECEPPEAWSSLTKIGWVMDPPFEELKVTLDSFPEYARVALVFQSQATDNDYPLETRLLLFAAFNGEADPRLYEQNVVIKPPIDRPPPPPPILLDEPTQLKLRSRKPIKLFVGDADRHVVLQWDGKDELVTGVVPRWKLRVYSTSHQDYPTIAVTRPQQGRFQAIVPCPPDRSLYPPGTTITIQAEAIERTGRILSIQFEAIVEEPKQPPPEFGPRRANPPVPLAASRRPNYRIMEIRMSDYSTQECPWANVWDTSIAGAYIEPSEKAPLTLIVNVDHELYRAFLDAELKAKASEAAIKRHQTRYIAHLCYYLYQMYTSQRRDSIGTSTGSITEENQSDPTDERNVQEINRVSRMLVRLMQMMH